MVYREARNPWACQLGKAQGARQLAMETVTKTQLQRQKQMIIDLQRQLRDWEAWWSWYS